MGRSKYICGETIDIFGGLNAETPGKDSHFYFLDSHAEGALTPTDWYNTLNKYVFRKTAEENNIQS